MSSRTAKKRADGAFNAFIGVSGIILSPLCAVAAIIAYAASAGTLYEWLLLTSVLTLLAFLTAYYWPAKNPKIKQPIPGRLSLPSTYFMPFCVCPKCDVEELHWMNNKEWPEYWQPPTWYEHNKKCDCAMCIKVRQKAERMRQKAERRLANFDVIRTCRECDHTWGQKVGFTDEG